MIFDEDPMIRCMGYRNILRIRREGDDEFGIVRPHTTPMIYFNSQNYYDLINWNLPFNEPPFTRLIPYATLKELAISGDLIEDGITKIPCHNQACERAIKLVTEVATVSTTKARREGAALVAIEARKKRPN